MHDSSTVMSGNHRNVIRRLTGVLGNLQKRRLFARAFKESLETDSWTTDEIRAYHDRKLVGLVRDAAQNIPFYRDLYRQPGVDVGGFSGTEDLHTLPTIAKRDLLESGEKMVRPGVSSLRTSTQTTGGSTGTIATIVSQRGLSSLDSGCIYALWHRIGVKRGDRMVILRGALLNEGRDLWQLEKKRARLTISTYHINDQNVDRIISLIDDFEPDWLHVYPSAATLLGNILRRTGKRLTCHPKGVLCGSETVYPWQVELFADVFDCRTFSHYGHGESVLLGGWCEGTRMFHFLPNHGYVELLDDSGQVVSDPQVTGEITASGYLNTVMPLIRYRTEDYGSWDVPGPCPSCGREHQRLARIDGRIREYLLLGDGTRFPVTNINALHGMFFSLIYRFQFVQDAPGLAVLRFVPAVELTDANVEEIREAFAYLPEIGLKLEFQSVESIPLTPSGKQRVVVTSQETSGEQ